MAKQRIWKPWQIDHKVSTIATILGIGCIC